MPIVEKIVNEQCFVFVWIITEDEEKLISLCNSMFLNDLGKYKKIENRLQWLASRVLITQVFADFGVDCNIKKDEFGNPQIVNSDWNFSISHSGEYAALILSKNDFLGVDIETKFNQCHKLRSKFCNDFEIDFIGDDILKSTLIWSAKESIYKAYGKKKLIFKDDMKLADSGSFIFEFPKLKRQFAVEKKEETSFVLTYINLDISNLQL